jgi:alcohol dehydrogenase
MHTFGFNTVPAVVVECGAARRLGPLLRGRFTQTRLCLVTGKFLHRRGLLEPVLTSLRQAGWKVHVIDDVVADPAEAAVLAAAEQARRAESEVILGLGGGSAMDVAKLVAALAGSGQTLADMYGVGKVRRRGLPLVQMPTTAGTGSEVTPISIVTTGETTKAGVVSPNLLADLTILDAELTMALPPKVTAATGIDAIVHAIEAYTTKTRKNPMSDMFAREALRLLSTNLLPAFENGQDHAAREGMLLGAMLAGQAFANAPVAAVHALAYPIGGIFHVPHGLSNALVLPHVLRFNASAASALYAELADILVAGCTGSAEARTASLIARLEQFSQFTGIETRLRQVGIGEADLQHLSQQAMLQTRLLVNNPRELTQEDAYAMYLAAL